MHYLLNLCLKSCGQQNVLVVNYAEHCLVVCFIVVCLVRLPLLNYTITS